MSDVGDRMRSVYLAIWVVPPVLGTILILAATAGYGPGLTTDSASYVSAAESFRAGQGLLDVTGDPMTVFPPVLPLVLGILAYMGLDVLDASRLLGALCLAVVIGTTMHLAARLSRSTIAGFAAGFFVLVAVSVLDAFSYVWTEPLFVALLSCFVLIFGRAVAGDDTRSLLWASSIAAAIPLTRYIGVVLIPVGGLLLLWLGGLSWSRRLRAAAIFVTVSTLPLAAYLLRNFLIRGALAGERFPSARSLVSVLRAFVANTLTWIFPWEWIERLEPISDSPWALILLFVAAAGSAAGIVWLLALWWRQGSTTRLDRVQVGFLVLWFAAHSVFLCFSSWTVAFEPINPRYLVPVFPAAVVLLSVAMTVLVRRSREAATGAAGHPIRRLAVTGGVGAALLLVAVLQVMRAVEVVGDKRDNGAGGYATTAWVESPLARYLASNPPPVAALTNGPDVTFLLTGVRLGWLPRRGVPGQVDALNDAISRGGEVVVVWYERLAWRTYLIGMDQLQEMAAVDVYREEADGSVMTMRLPASPRRAQE